MMIEDMATSAETRPSTTQVAVVTVSYGSEDVLRPFLASLPAASAHPLTVIVADNKVDAADTVVARLTADAGATYLPLETNCGYGGAINRAVAALPAEIEWVVVSNPDVTVNPGAIDTLLDSIRGHDLVGSVGPRILSSDGSLYPSARSIPSLRSGVGHALFANVWPNNPWTRGYRRESLGAVVRRDAGWLSGAFLIVRRSVFDELAGFDEGYFMYFEDVDLGYRIGRLGLRNVYEPAATVVHTGAHSTTSDSRRMARAHHDSARRFLTRKYSGPLLWPVRTALNIGLLVRSRLAERRLPD
jgi:N-acetylglucosaminyl-diphospho-decaprenol L-rhamnosyltransferase